MRYLLWIHATRSEFAHYSMEDVVKKTQSMCEGGLQRAKNAKLPAAQTRQHSQDVKEHCNHLYQAGQRREVCLRSQFLLSKENMEIEHTNYEIKK